VIETCERMGALLTRPSAIWSASTLPWSNWSGAPHCRFFFEIPPAEPVQSAEFDVDIVLDLMIHDVDIVLALTHAEPEEIRAAGISILSEKVDIANVRLQFPNGGVANLTASASPRACPEAPLFSRSNTCHWTMRRKDLAIFTVGEGRRIGFEQLPVVKDEPLKLQLESFLDLRGKSEIRRNVPDARASKLRSRVGDSDKIREHSEVVSQTLVAGWKQ